MVRKMRGHEVNFPELPIVFDEAAEEGVEEECENHIYLPIDSTKRFLACKNCGHIIKNEDV